MPRKIAPSPAADPRHDLARLALTEMVVATPSELRREQERMNRNDPMAPRQPPVVFGSRSDGTALASLIAVLAALGLVVDKTEA